MTSSTIAIRIARMMAMISSMAASLSVERVA
jgi:hypothetical protein